MNESQEIKVNPWEGATQYILFDIDEATLRSYVFLKMDLEMLNDIKKYEAKKLAKSQKNGGAS
jgi:hypothetical protein